MPGDYTRRTFNPRRDRVGVFQQQGRVTVDADFNELVDLLDRRLRVTADDTFGGNAGGIRRAVIPSETPNGFRITVAGADVTIGPGRAYVDGILADNHGGPPDAFDGVTEEVRGTGDLPYDPQPYQPAPPPITRDGTYLVYLDVWHRERTWVEEPSQLDPALYGVDTASRRQVVWQVKALGDVGDNVDCSTPDADVPGWPALLAGTPSRLTTAAVAVPADDDPCEVPPEGGYRGAENRLYRVQVHQPGPAGTATFVWSRDDASVASPVLAITGAVVRVVRTGRDKIARFSPNDWVEVIDDDRELAGLPGELALVQSVDDGLGEITLTAALAGTWPADPTTTATRIRKWDQKLDAGGSPLPTTGTQRGSLVINANPVVLEDGVQVTFSLDGGTDYRTGDYWVFAARTADASVEALAAAPPIGPHHHLARLAFVNLESGLNTDCRQPWPPTGGGEGCECDVCVTPESHNSGTLTIQQAVDRVRDRGGSVCLAVGVYRLEETVRVQRGKSVRIGGKGAATIVLTPGEEPAFLVESSAQVTIEDLAVLGSVGRGDEPVRATVSGGVTEMLKGLAGRIAIAARNVVGFTVQRCVLVTMPVRDDELPTIALLGVIAGLDLRENVVVGVVGIGNVAGQAKTQGTVAGFAQADRLMLIEADVRDNIVLGARDAIAFTGAVVHAGAVTIADNTVAALLAGIALLGLAVPVAATAVRSNLVVTPGVGIGVGIDGARVEDNDVVGTVASRQPTTMLGRLVTAAPFADAWETRVRPGARAKATANPVHPFAAAAQEAVLTGYTQQSARAGILLVGGALAERRIDRCRIVGNRVSNTRGPGIAVLARVGSVAIEDNRVDGAHVGGIVVLGRSGGRAMISGNELVATTGSGDDHVVAGISVTGLLQADIRGNTIVGVAHRTAKLVAGVVVDTVGGANITDNTVLDIGGNEAVRGAAGIVAEGPFDRLDIADNEIRRSSTGEKLDGQWMAVLVSSLQDQVIILPNRRKVVVGDTAHVVGPAFVASIPVGREITAVRGNLGDGSGRGPIVSARVNGHLTVSDNRCLLQPVEEVVPAIRARASSAIVSANYVESAFEGLALELLIGDGAFSVVGNVATGGYQVNGSPLAAPWDALNVVAP